MVRNSNGRAYECTLVDLNTQLDFCWPSGAFPVANAGTLTPALRHMIAWAKRNCAPVVSSIDSHRLYELPMPGLPVHCVDGSRGQRKIDYTMFPLCIRVEVDNTLDVPLDLFSRCQQVIFRQRGQDLLANPKADRFLTQLPTREFIVFGNTIEASIKVVALGLVAREKRVTVIADACGYWNRARADLALRQIRAKGGRIMTVEELLTRKLERKRKFRRIEKHAGSGNGRKHTTHATTRGSGTASRSRIPGNGSAR